MNQNVVKLGHQLREIWKQLGVNQRVSVVLATGVVLVGIVSIVWWSSRGDYSLLYGRLSDSEAAKVISALNDAKVPYQIGSGGSSILVPSDKVYLMRMQLASKGIPQSDGVGFEIFDKPNFGISDFVQHANYIRALQGELARTISQINEVESARVMVVMPENRLLIDKDKHPTASVFVRLRDNTRLAPEAVNAIRFLVANSVEGLKPNFVSVVDNQGNVLSENIADDSLVGLTATQLDARRNLEQYLAKKAQGMLEKVLGPGQAIVQVSADINFDTVQRTDEKFDPDGQVIRTQTKDQTSEDSSTSSSDAAVGVSANTPGNSNGVAQAASPVTNTKNTKTTDTTEYEISKSTSNIVQAAGGIKRLTASVTVAANVEGTGANRKVVPRTPAELDKIRSMVMNALGIDTARGDQVTVEEMPFNNQFAADITQELNTQDRRQFWWKIARNVGYPALAIGILLVFLRSLKRTAADEIPIGVPIGRMPLNGKGNGLGHRPAFAERGAARGQDAVTAEVLNQLIKENPDNMTQAIRGWLSRGSNASQ